MPQIFSDVVLFLLRLVKLAHPACGIGQQLLPWLFGKWQLYLTVSVGSAEDRGPVLAPPQNEAQNGTKECFMGGDEALAAEEMDREDLRRLLETREGVSYHT